MPSYTKTFQEQCSYYITINTMGISDLIKILTIRACYSYHKPFQVHLTFSISCKNDNVPHTCT